MYGPMVVGWRVRLEQSTGDLIQACAPWRDPFHLMTSLQEAARWTWDFQISWCLMTELTCLAHTSIKSFWVQAHLGKPNMYLVRASMVIGLYTKWIWELLSQLCWQEKDILSEMWSEAGWNDQVENANCFSMIYGISVNITAVETDQLTPWARSKGRAL